MLLRIPEPYEQAGYCWCVFLQSDDFMTSRRFRREAGLPRLVGSLKPNSSWLKQDRVAYEIFFLER